jgi:hypothetical protein
MNENVNGALKSLSKQAIFVGVSLVGIFNGGDTFCIIESLLNRVLFYLFTVLLSRIINLFSEHFLWSFLGDLIHFLFLLFLF